MGAIEVTMHSGECDQCGKQLEADKNGFNCWIDEAAAEEAAREQGWEINEDGDAYCTDCVKEVTADGRIILNEPIPVHIDGKIIEADNKGQIKVTPRPPLKGELFQKGEKALYNTIEVEVISQDELRLRTVIKIPHSSRRGFNKADVFTNSLTKIK